MGCAHTLPKLKVKLLPTFETHTHYEWLRYWRKASFVIINSIFLYGCFILLCQNAFIKTVFENLQQMMNLSLLTCSESINIEPHDSVIQMLDHCWEGSSRLMTCICVDTWATLASHFLSHFSCVSTSSITRTDICFHVWLCGTMF